VSLTLTLLAWSAALLGLYLGPQSLLYRAEHGVKFAAGARDGEPAPQSPYLQRAEKALRNFLETYPAFIALAVVIELGHRESMLSLWGTSLYVGARIAYLPLYVFGVQYVRSLVWCVSAIGLALLFVAAVG